MEPADNDVKTNSDAILDDVTSNNDVIFDDIKTNSDAILDDVTNNNDVILDVIIYFVINPWPSSSLASHTSDANTTPGTDFQFSPFPATNKSTTFEFSMFRNFRTFELI